MKILITGATGMIGQEIVKVCQENGHTVHYLTRSHEKIDDTETYKGFHWNLKTMDIDDACFSGVEAIINLAGAPISERWTSDYKKVILNSRLNSLELLKKELGKIDQNVGHIVSASAIGVYPDSLTNYYTETEKSKSDTFLGEVVKSWEQKADSFSELGLKVSKVRIGLVLSDKGGALPQMTKPIKYGAGAAFGSGKQWQSWIHIEDLAQIFVKIAEEKLEGLYNGVAPNPVTNKVLTETAANVMDKPLILPNIPKFVMKLALGEMHILLFESQRVSSEKIESKGYDYKYHNLEPALKDLLAND